MTIRAEEGEFTGGLPYLAVGEGPPLLILGGLSIHAEDAFDVQAELGQIVAPTLVVGGARDGFYSPELFEATERGIPDARLVLRPRGTHVSVMRDHTVRLELARFLG